MTRFIGSDRERSGKAPISRESETLLPGHTMGQKQRQHERQHDNAHRERSGAIGKGAALGKSRKSLSLNTPDETHNAGVGGSNPPPAILQLAVGQRVVAFFRRAAPEFSEVRQHQRQHGAENLTSQPVWRSIAGRIRRVVRAALSRSPRAAELDSRRDLGYRHADPIVSRWIG